ncbi:MAG: PEP-CTERM sorting domain-containing protein [Minwuiales bacterium]|nr:PEP-CTERM sorting domain-containing protein [Minwuiales bacterium]
MVADFTDPVAAPHASLVFDLGGGLSVTVTGHSHNGGASGDAPFDTLLFATLSQNSEGLGITSPGGPGTDPDLDAAGVDELLRFTFNQPVTLFSVVFENVGSLDEFDMSVDQVDLDIDALLGSDSLEILPEGGFGDDSNLADFTGDGLTGTVFDFYTDDAGDAYRVRQFLVEAVGDGGGSDGGKDVPAPPALMLLGLGLAGLGLARRRPA